MKTKTKITLAAAALLLAGTAGMAGFAAADHRDNRDGRRHSGWHGKHHDGGWRGHRRGRWNNRYGGSSGWHGRRRHGGRRLMERFDADKNGKLTQDELDTGRKELLARHDGNKDGTLSVDEFGNLWLEVKRQRMVRGFQRLDKDGDASITADEFLKPFANLIAKLDRNDDGVFDNTDRRHRYRARRSGRINEAPRSPDGENN